jgi:hypothetical protein
MKKVVILLLLFYAKTVTAQPFNIGITAGGLDYHFRQQPAFLGVSYYSFGLCGQYIFKDSGAVGIEANVYCNPSGVNFSTGYFDTYKGFSSAEYLLINPFPKRKGLILQFKAGLFYATYDASSGLPKPDYGPAVGVYLGIFKLSKKSYLGLDVDYMWGLQNYLITGNVEGQSYTLTGNSNISYVMFSLKFIHKI